jgi:transcriptional regulator with XRE-family HTH domain
MIKNDDLIITSQLKKNIGNVFKFLIDNKEGLGLDGKEISIKLKISESTVSAIKNDSREISAKAIKEGIISRLINIYNVNPDFIYNGKGKIVKGIEGNIVSEERAYYGNKEYLIESLNKDITMLKEEIRHLNEASLLKDEFIAQLKENKQMLEQKLNKSGIKSGI